MIVYKTTGWLEAIWHFHTGATARGLLRRVAVVFVYVTAISIAELRFLDLKLKYTPSEFFAAMGILLSLLLIFRTNTAYDRFYEGRTAWGTLVNTCRSLAVALQAILPPTHRDDRLFFAKMIANFPFALKNHLRETRNMDELDETDAGEKSELNHLEHVPNGLASLIRTRIEQLYRDKIISDAQLINLNELVISLTTVNGICERIKSTPIPFSYNLFIKIFITLYVIVLPFSILDEFGYMTIPTVTITSYILIGVEMIGEEIEQPFGLDRNDLPLNQLSQMIRVNVHEIMQIFLPHIDKRAAKPKWVIVT